MFQKAEKRVEVNESEAEFGNSAKVKKRIEAEGELAHSYLYKSVNAHV